VTTALPFSPRFAPSLSHSAPVAHAIPVATAGAVASRHTAPSACERPSGPRPLTIAAPLPRPTPAIPRSTPERLLLGRERIRGAAEAGQRIRSYEVALDLDLSEFHFARLFRAAFGRSPHVYYDEVRAERARALLREGLSEGEVARRIGFRRPAELRALLSKRGEPGSEASTSQAAAD
jgi:AraC-like DNA-binding protein